MDSSICPRVESVYAVAKCEVLRDDKCREELRVLQRIAEHLMSLSEWNSCCHGSSLWKTRIGKEHSP